MVNTSDKLKIKIPIVLTGYISVDFSFCNLEAMKRKPH